MCSTPVPPEDKFRLIGYSLTFSDISVLFVTPLHFQNVMKTHPGKRAKALKQPTMTAGPAFTVDAPLIVESKEGCLRKRLNRNLFGYYMPQLGGDDMLFSMPLFNATPHSSCRSRRRSRT